MIYKSTSISNGTMGLSLVALVLLKPPRKYCCRDCFQIVGAPALCKLVTPVSQRCFPESLSWFKKTSAYIHTYIHTYILNYITLHCIALHCITLHYITYIHTYTHTHIHIHIYICIYIYTVYISGWWVGTFFVFPYIGNVMIPTDEHIFRRGRSTTNQISLLCIYIYTYMFYIYI